MSLTEYIKDRLTDCDSATAEECRDIIEGMEYMLDNIKKWGAAESTTHNDEWYELVGFADDIAIQLGDAILKAERILAETEAEEAEELNYSDNYYKPVRM